MFSGVRKQGRRNRDQNQNGGDQSKRELGVEGRERERERERAKRVFLKKAKAPIKKWSEEVLVGWH